MAYFIRSWLSAQARRAVQITVVVIQSVCFCFRLKGRMKDGIAYAILGILGLIVVYTAFNCSSKFEHY